MTRLTIIVPIVITLVFLMLCLTFGSIGEALLIIINVPLALIGGILGLFMVGEYLSVPAAVGFIALFGIAVQNGVVLVSCINQLRTEGVEIKEAIITGSLQRLRPVLMTATTTVLGLVASAFVKRHRFRSSKAVSCGGGIWSDICDFAYAFCNSGLLPMVCCQNN